VPLISVRSLTKRYDTVTALDGLSVEIEPGIVGLVGSNGAGKTTLLKILLGLIDATSGEASVFDLDVRTHGTDIRQFVGYMPEHDCLPPDVSATDVVSHLALMSGLPRTAARERTAEVLRHVGLYEERYRAIGGYSTGMKQRVKLAQALVHDPRLLLLDEPTNGLDPAGRDEMLELVRRTGTEFGIAVIVASHLLGEIERVCDHLVAIEAGRLLRAAPLHAFTEQTGTLAVEVEEGSAALADRLMAAGFEAIADGRAVLMAMADVRAYDVVRDAVVDLGLPLIRIEQRRHRLEDLFRDGPVGAGAAAAEAPPGSQPSASPEPASPEPATREPAAPEPATREPAAPEPAAPAAPPAGGQGPTSGAA
jgi:ABC-2 type transport system ATP-binding protein